MTSPGEEQCESWAKKPCVVTEALSKMNVYTWEKPCSVLVKVAVHSSGVEVLQTCFGSAYGWLLWKFLEVSASVQGQQTCQDSGGEITVAKTFFKILPVWGHCE